MSDSEEELGGYDPNENVERDLQHAQLEVLRQTAQREAEAKRLVEQQLALQHLAATNQGAQVKVQERVALAHERAAALSEKNLKLNAKIAKAQARQARALTHFAKQFERLVGVIEAAIKEEEGCLACHGDGIVYSAATKGLRACGCGAQPKAQPKTNAGPMTDRIE